MLRAGFGALDGCLVPGGETCSKQAPTKASSASFPSAEDL